MQSAIRINDHQGDAWATSLVTLRAYVEFMGWSVERRGDTIFVIMPYDAENGEPEVYADFCANLPNFALTPDEMDTLHEFEAVPDAPAGLGHGMIWAVDPEVWASVA